LPTALDLQYGSTHNRFLRFFITTQYSCDILNYILFSYKLFISILY
jgi:hypothetical protein